MGSHGYKHSFSPGESSCLPREGQPKRSGILYILPCTVSQLRSATELRESFFIRDLELNQLSVVGLIRRTKPASEFVLYSLDDMTGAPMDVKQWMNLEDENMNSRFIPPGTYVKVVGSLHSFQHHRSMVAFSVRRLQDLNEITSHMLEVVQTHLFNHNNSGTMREQMKNKAMTWTPQCVPYSNESATYGFTAIQSQVLNLIKSCPLAEGISIQSLKAALKYLTPYDISACLRFLISEGHIFSTIDDDHFKSTYF
ncbi:replication protein A 32 kDa subunit-like isoform X1 [Hoplias malabaricus]|uniref:replication protein A 32 kDa subunit-like isoform X1 n=1 Tax=Hoplias malabaricus TaxID=27720 RepID=UPI0034627E02